LPINRNDTIARFATNIDGVIVRIIGKDSRDKGLQKGNLEHRLSSQAIGQIRWRKAQLSLMQFFLIIYTSFCLGITYKDEGNPSSPRSLRKNLFWGFKGALETVQKSLNHENAKDTKKNKKRVIFNQHISLCFIRGLNSSDFISFLLPFRVFLISAFVVFLHIH
jgi:hypothetical protein